MTSLNSLDVGIYWVAGKKKTQGAQLRVTVKKGYMKPLNSPQDRVANVAAFAEEDTEKIVLIDAGELYSGMVEHHIAPLPSEYIYKNLIDGQPSFNGLGRRGPKHS